MSDVRQDEVGGGGGVGEGCGLEDRLRASEQRFRDLIVRQADGVLVVDGEGRIRFANPAAERLLGRGVGELEGTEFGYAVDGEPMQTVALRPPGRPVVVAEMRVGPTEWEGRAAWVVTLNDVTGRVRVELMRACETAVLEAVSLGRGLGVVLAEVVRGIEAVLVGSVASVMLVDGEGRRLRFGAGSHLPDAYRRVIDGALIGPESGSCGAAAYRRQTVRVADVGVDPVWRVLGGTLLAHGLRASWSTPVCGTDGRVLATVGVHHRDASLVVEEDRVYVERATHLVRLAIERDEREQALRASEVRFRAIVENEPECVKTVSVDGRLLDMNPAGLAMIEAEDLESVRGQAVLRLVHPEDRGRFMELHRRAAKGERGQERFRIVGLRGTERWMETHSTPLRGPDGSIVSVLSVTRDVTARRRVEAELAASKRQMQMILESVGEGIHGLDVQGRVVFENAAALAMFGWDEAEVLGADAHGLMHHHRADGREYPSEECPIWRTLRDGQVRRVEDEVFFRRDGRSFPVEYTCAPVRDESGVITGAVVSFRDMTERVESRQNLRESEQRFRAFMDNCPASAFIKDADGRIVYANDAWVAQFGLEVPEWEGRTDFDLWPEATARKFRESDLECLRLGVAIQREETGMTPGGEERHWQVVKYPVPTGSGVGVGGMAWDVTHRRRAEAKLRQQAALLDLAQDAILVRDLGHRVEYWNKSAERLYGWRAEEVMGRSVRDLLYQEAGAFEVATAATLERGEWVGEIVQYGKGGRKLVVEGRWTLVRDDAGRPRSILAINTDVTERRLIEAQFLRAQRMESIGTLAGGIAHDLNNVLAPILMSIQLLRMPMEEGEREEILNTIETSARRGADLVRQVLSFARGMEGRKVEVQVRHLMRDILKIVNETFMKTIVVRSAMAEGLWTVTGDPTQLHQVLLNLCVNARDAMPLGGTLTLSATNLMLDEQYAKLNADSRPGPYVMLEVEDTGSGIPGEILEKIFDPFFTTKEPGKGTGLGLSTSLAIVRSHGGFIRVYSEHGRGSRFRVYLPAKERATEVVSEPVPELPRGRGECVLVVDDEASVREVTRRTLEAFGYRVMTASDGAEAVAVYAKHREVIALVLTDMMMPVMDGPAAVQVLTQMNPKVRILAASGLNASGLVARAAHAGARHFLPKPYTAETLLVMVRRLLDEEV